MLEERGVPGAGNDITDVAGILAGHHQRLDPGWATGATAVLAPEGAVAGVDVRGGGPGTRETDLLDPVNMVQRVHGVSLAGGSAFGLAAADGVMRWLAERAHGLPVGTRSNEVVPIVPGAVLFDLPYGTWGNRPDAGFGYAACEDARARPSGRGNLGAGTGATVDGLKGGIGSASEVLPRDGSSGPEESGASESGPGITVGALLAANSAGSGVDLATGLPWAAGEELAAEFGLLTPPEPEVRSGAERLGGSGAAIGEGNGSRLNTTIGAVATDARLTKSECRRVAMSAHDGLARALRPAHSMFDGDTLFALSTERAELATEAGPFGPPGRARDLDRVCAAAARAVARALVHALLAARSLSGVICYTALYPSVRPV